MTEDELLWGLYKDNRLQAQLHEDRRSTATALIVGGAGAVVATLMRDGLDQADLPLAPAVIVLGIAGWLIAIKATERMALHNARCRSLLKELDKLFPDRRIIEWRKTTDDAHARKHRLFFAIHLSWLWQWLNLAIAIGGAWLIYLIEPSLFPAIHFPALHWPF